MARARRSSPIRVPRCATCTELDVGRAADSCRIAGGSVVQHNPRAHPPVIRKGASGTFYDKGLEGASHHAVIPNVNTIDKLRRCGLACRR